VDGRAKFEWRDKNVDSLTNWQSLTFPCGAYLPLCRSIAALAAVPKRQGRVTGGMFSRVDCRKPIFYIIK